jgi:hypothetical protein
MSTSGTNGWDAICAMNLKQVNSLLLQQYLRNGPTSPAMPLRLILNAESQFWVLDVVLGPPELSFQAGSQNATLEMELVRGSLIAFNPQTNSVLNAVRIRPKESSLTGPLTLAKMDVKDTLGSLVADLGAAAYTPKIGGVDPASVLNTALGLAVQTYFADNETRFPIGTIAPAQVSASLQPTDFKFHTQQKAGSSEACVLLLIQTNGTAGSVEPFEDYPIPAGCTAALRISARALFNGLLPEYLNGAFSQLGTRFSGQQSGDAWSTMGSGGTIDYGKIGEERNRGGDPWSADCWSGKAKPVVIPMGSFAVSASQGSLSANWSCQYTSCWGEEIIGPYPDERLFPATFELSLSLSSKPIVDPVTDQVTFPGTPSISVRQTDGYELLGPISTIQGGLRQNLQTTLNSFQLPSVNTFALTNLLFPANHVISLTGVALPGDLNLTGSMVAPIAVTPANSAIAPDATVQFNAAGSSGSDILWEIKPRVGSISSTGLYTAPASITEAQVIVATAVSKSDPSVTGSAMVLVYSSPAATGVAVAPGSSVVTPGQTLQLSATDAAGNAVSVDWTLSPNVGQISQSFGQHIYTAPSSIASATKVTVTAKNHSDPSKSGVAVIQVTPQATVAVTPATATVKAGAKLALTATASPGDVTDVCWAVYPIGAGTVTPDDSNPGKAIYTAPQSIGQNPAVSVVAYLVDDEAAGLGASAITLAS